LLITSFSPRSRYDAHINQTRLEAVPMTRNEVLTELAIRYHELGLLQAKMRSFRTFAPSAEEILPVVKAITECQVRIFALEELL
jgi:hypothetical protein